MAPTPRPALASFKGAPGTPAACRRLRAVAVALALVAVGCGRRQDGEAPSAPPLPKLAVADELGAVLDGDSAFAFADTSGAAPLWERVRAFYDVRRRRLAWSRDLVPRPEADQLVAAIRGSAALGLDPRDYELDALGHQLALARRDDRVARSLRPRTLARFDARATYAYARLARDLRHGRLAGDTLDGDWARRDEDAFWEDVFERAGQEDPRPMLAGLEPRDDRYVRLRSALERYRAIAAAGGWLEVPAGPPLARGATGARVTRLIRRLVASGELSRAPADSSYDRAVEQAVGDLQSRHGVPRSGIVGEATRAILNVPVETRIRQIELNLERWRWLPADLGELHVMVDIPAYRLDVVRQGAVQRSHRVVVGKRISPTPVFTDALVYLELNPSWTVPPNIVFKEIVPALRRQPDYFAKNRMIVVTSTATRDTIDPTTIPWAKLKPDSCPYLVIQDAGTENPLGRIKLMCPNEYDVYLHDTPQRERFADAARDYSHGCVRVSLAEQLADSLMGLTPADTIRLDSLIATGQWRRIRLPKPVPVHFLYWTAWADSAGRVSFRNDLYGLDQRLEKALTAPDTSAFVLNPGVSKSPYWLAAEQKAREKALEKAGRKAPRSKPTATARPPEHPVGGTR